MSQNYGFKDIDAVRYKLNKLSERPIIRLQGLTPIDTFTSNIDKKDTASLKAQIAKNNAQKKLDAQNAANKKKRNAVTQKRFDNSYNSLFSNNGLFR